MYKLEESQKKNNRCTAWKKTLFIIFVFFSCGLALEAQDSADSSAPAKDSSRIKSLQDIVVVGYGTSNKRSVTGATVGITAKELSDQPVSSFEQALVGKMAGVQISQNTGAPGGSINVRIRGTSSLTAGAEPLYVIDGFPISNELNNTPDFIGAVGTATGTPGNFTNIQNFKAPNAMASFNSDDIQSIDILKDASSAAIYGSRGATGVVFITTKSGSSRKGKTTVDYNAYVGLQEVAHTLPLGDAYQWSKAYREGKINRLMDQTTLDFKEAGRLIDSISLLNIYTITSTQKSAIENRFKSFLKSGASLPNIIYFFIAPEVLPYLGKSGISAYEPLYKNKDTLLNNTDWQKAIFRVGLIQNHTIGVSGGSEKTSYYLSGNYFNQDGIILNSNFKRYGFRANMTSDVSKKVTVGVTSTATYTINNAVSSDGPYSSDGIMTSVAMASPIFPVYNADGSVAVDRQSSWNKTNGSIGNFGTSANNIPLKLLPSGVTSAGVSTVGADPFGVTSIENPVALASLIKDVGTTFRFLGGFYMEYKILKGLKFKTYIGADLNSYSRNYFRPSTLGIPNSSSITYLSGNPYNNVGFSQGTQSYNIVWENTLNYKFDVKDKNHFDVLAGYSLQSAKTNSTFGIGMNYITNSVTTLGGSTNTTNTQVYSNVNEWSLVSAFLRVNYNFDYKYIFSFVMRTDGSSRFGENNKYGYFPSISAAWNMKEEKFLDNVDFITDLKLRVSYGLTGNMNIGNYASYSTASSGNNYPYPVSSGAIAPGQSLGNLANPNLKWDNTKQFNVGVDLSLLRSRVNVVVDFYRSTTDDILFNVPVALSSSFATSLTNSGSVRNQGIEIFFSTKNVSTKNFSWETRFNFSKNTNEVVSLGSNNTPIIVSGSAQSQYKTEVGQPIGNYYGFQVDKVIQTQSELDAYRKIYFLDNTTPQLGDRAFRDINGDGKLDANDKTNLGNYQPDFIYGLTNQFAFYGFDVSIELQGVQGSKLNNIMRRYTMNSEGNMNTLIEVFDNRYIDESSPGNGVYPRLNRTSNAQSLQSFSSYHIEDGSYLRFRNLTVGYTLKNAWFKNKIQKLRIYFSIQNLYTWTNYTGYSPEVSMRPSNVLSPGEDYGTYPTARTYTLGINFRL